MDHDHAALPTLYKTVQETAARYPRLAALEFLGHRTTYLQFLNQIHRAARGFQAIGVRRGDRVAICMPNCPQALIAFYALNRLGAVCAMLHPLAAPGELVHSLEITGAGVLLILDKLAKNLPPDQIRQRIVITARLPMGGPSKRLPGQLRWRDLLAAGDRSRRPLPTLASWSDAPAVILFSGGTTGTPKGVLLSNGNFQAAAGQLLQASGLTCTAGLRMLSVLPLFHGFGLGVGVHAALAAGACCVLVPRFRAKTFGRLLLRTRPNVIPGVPALFEALCRSDTLQHADLGFLRGLYCGGDTLRPEQHRRIDQFLRERGSPVGLRQGYGLTECVAAACLTPPDCRRPGSVGMPLPGMACKICRPGTTEALPAGVRGEICLSGPTCMLEYVQDPAETALTLRRHSDGRRWLHTGDLGHVDGDGYLYFAQRLKRMIVTSGYNVYPQRLEAVLQTHPGIREVCVVGVPDPCRGQRVRAVIVPADPGLTAAAVRIWCRSHIARYALPREIVFRDALPRTALGKIDFGQLCSAIDCGKLEP